jgi:hypothetical protein
MMTPVPQSPAPQSPAPHPTSPATSRRGFRARWRAFPLAARAAIVLLVAVVGVNLLLAGLESATGGPAPGGPTGSSLATGPRGLAAYRDLLGRFGTRVETVRGNLSEADLDRSKTLVVIDPSRFDEQEGKVLRQFVDGGGRLVAGGSVENPTAWLHSMLADPPRWRPSAGREARPVGSSPDVAGVSRVRTAGEGAWTSLEPDDVSLTESDGSVIVLVRQVGRGTVVLLADPSPIQNRLLDQADNALLALNLGGRTRPVVFAEGVHGYGRSRGLGRIPTGWKVALGGLVLAALVGMVAKGRRLGPPEDDSRALPPPRRAYVDALATTLSRTNDPAQSLASLQATTRAGLARRAGLPADAGNDALADVARGLGWPDDEIQAMTGPLQTADEVLAAGRALARLEGRTR